MTSKKKAEELVERFMGINQFLNPENTNQKQAAKWCALIVGDEMLQWSKHSLGPTFDYWCDVKREIELL